MSFISKTQGKGYEAGYFLANNEDVTRETREASANSALVVTEANGTKYLPAGTAYPTNDGNAIGIVYEDVDVSDGNMPASIVTKGEIYEDKLAITATSYDAVTPVGTENPSEKGWYERSGTEGSYVYTLTTDTTVDSEKTYYEYVITRLASSAKSALTSLGFKFKTSPTITRP